MSTIERSSLRWVGCGKTALLGWTAPAREALEEVFIANGGADYLLETSPPPQERSDGEDALGWDELSFLMGEDGGPGERSGLYKLAERENLGTLVLPPVVSGAAGLLEDFALQHPRLLVCCSVATDPATAELPRPVLRRPLPNILLLKNTPPGESVAAALAGYLYSRDFFPLRTPSEVERSRLGIRSGVGLEKDRFPFCGELRGLVAWRRWQGLYRSLDEGTRWTVFEFASESMVRRLERELRAFLHSLGVDGFLPFRNGFDLEVAMEGSGLDTDEADERRLSIEVRARLDSGAGVAVERVFSPAPGEVEIEEATI